MIDLRDARHAAIGIGAIVIVGLFAATAVSLPTAGGDAVACSIKGNINPAGVRIYHMPGQDYYDRTRISASRGERWFCSEDEARRAGWRRAKR